MRQWDYPRRALGGLWRYAKLGWNRLGGFEDMGLSTLCEFGLKCLVTPLLGSFGGKLGKWKL